ncbi:hypothetical protein JD292_11630 [Leucobacter sp. CSA2]|uniref:Uncharacterized protein n=1 Tax=Leucobacter edaphi TaxID=2796472 RepID=A0A934QFN5_9MICO|nr:hypothetical protein [Leucobacter edaphi]MBK0422722.1 hypothetical protein [Leucobacter edaphi]
MSHKNHNDELREDRFEQEEKRQRERDEVFDETGGTTESLGSQDRRREEGDERG